MKVHGKEKQIEVDGVPHWVVYIWASPAPRKNCRYIELGVVDDINKAQDLRLEWAKTRYQKCNRYKPDPNQLTIKERRRIQQMERRCKEAKARKKAIKPLLTKGEQETNIKGIEDCIERIENLMETYDEETRKQALKTIAAQKQVIVELEAKKA